MSSKAHCVHCGKRRRLVNSLCHHCRSVNPDLDGSETTSSDSEFPNVSSSSSPSPVALAFRYALGCAADVVRGKRDSRKGWARSTPCASEDGALLELQEICIDEAIEIALTEIADAFDVLAESFVQGESQEEKRV